MTSPGQANDIARRSLIGVGTPRRCFLIGQRCNQIARPGEDGTEFSFNFAGGCRIFGEKRQRGRARLCVCFTVQQRLFPKENESHTNFQKSSEQ
ncbi:hypothetical protein ATANTOWER_012058 [Ataeniobius toweri]|uniref:Uncharacterized protein n=1 Tax=Ataeniobius toweri TaxID=208326 RepID=A0ABU7BI96_9TELE|nr:hypothetical protein [Ataeniobius toweri]